MSDADERKKTQGEIKMRRYIADLVRNKGFKRKFKRLERASKKDFPAGMYDTWTPAQQKKHDAINKEIGELIDGYELLRKRCKKLFKEGGFKEQRTLAEVYGLDNDLTGFVRALLAGDENMMRYWDWSLDMCRTENLYEEQLSPLNKGEEIIYLRPSRQTELMAYPLAIRVHSKASKRDILDYIEKRWKWIESLLRMSEEEKILRARKRKHTQEMLDFMWELRSIPSKEIKKKLDERFPKNGLVYDEINKTLSLERKRRTGDIS